VQGHGRPTEGTFQLAAPILAQSVNTPQEPQDILPVATNTQYRTIAVTNIVVGQDDTVATFDLKIGGVLVRRCSLRCGRGNATYINYPSQKDDSGRWVHLFEIVSPSLESAVRQAIHAAVAEVVR
jgi:hypothetical protein